MLNSRDSLFLYGAKPKFVVLPLQNAEIQDYLEGEYMIAEIIILIFALLFFVLSAFLFKGKCKWLIAGYNTASTEERKKFDEKKLCKAVGFVCVVCAVMLCIMAYMGYKVDSGVINEDMMLLFGLIFAVVIFISLFVAARYIKTKAKK